MTINIQRLSASDADILIAGASAKANEIGIPMCIAITDESGNLIAFRRMDGGEVVGGFGLSSGTPQQDMQCAQSGLDQFERSIAEH
jgi:uncharacterized protein GlcG (DUF336 family)